MTEQDYSPEERQVIAAVVSIWEENPATEILGCAKLLALVKQRNPTWLLSEKRLKSILKQHGLQTSTQQVTFSSKVKSSIISDPDIDIASPSGVSVTMTKSRGKALHATQAFEQDQEIWTEEPMIVIPSLEKVPLMRKALACAYCSQTFQHRSSEGIPEGGSECNLCMAQWCSTECHKADVIHAAIWHNNPHSKVDEEKWQEFESMCLEHDWTDVYAAGLISMTLLKDPSKNNVIRQQFESMASIREDERESLLGIQRDEKQNEAFELLQQAMSQSIELTWDEYMTTIGTYKLNKFERCLYAVQSQVNHSCEPNVKIVVIDEEQPHPEEEGEEVGEVKKDHESGSDNNKEEDKDDDKKRQNHCHNIRAIATKSIRPGEELVISYVNSDQELTARRQQIRLEYGFLCNCSKCKREDDQVNAAAQATLDGERDELALYADLQAKMRPRRKSVRFDEQVEVA